MAHPALTDPTTLNLIDRKVNALARTWGVSASQVDDIRQDIYLDLLERLPQHDPEKSPVALFISACVHRKIYNVIRHELAQRNGPVRDSIERMEDEMATTGARIEISAADAAGEREDRLRDLRIDLAAATKSLTDEEKELMQDLMSESIAIIARRTGRTRKMIYRIITNLRQKFAKHGLERYIGGEGTLWGGRG